MTLRRLIFPPCVKFRFDYNMPFRTIMSVWGQLIAKTTKRSFCAWSTKRPRPQRTNNKGLQASKWPCEFWVHFLCFVTMFCDEICMKFMLVFWYSLIISRFISFLPSDRIYFILQIKARKFIFKFIFKVLFTFGSWRGANDSVWINSYLAWMQNLEISGIPNTKEYVCIFTCCYFTLESLYLHIVM